ncbi:hypothetical protein CTAM01_15067, partial [Colletotrichum tamarilloi]
FLSLDHQLGSANIVPDAAWQAQTLHGQLLNSHRETPALHKISPVTGRRAHLTERTQGHPRRPRRAALNCILGSILVSQPPQGFEDWQRHAVPLVQRDQGAMLLAMRATPPWITATLLPPRQGTRADGCVVGECPFSCLGEERTADPIKPPTLWVFWRVAPRSSSRKDVPLAPPCGFSGHKISIKGPPAPEPDAYWLAESLAAESLSSLCGMPEPRTRHEKKLGVMQQPVSRSESRGKHMVTCCIVSSSAYGRVLRRVTASHYPRGAEMCRVVGADLAAATFPPGLSSTWHESQLEKVYTIQLLIMAKVERLTTSRKLETQLALGPISTRLRVPLKDQQNQ